MNLALLLFLFTSFHSNSAEWNEQIIREDGTTNNGMFIYSNEWKPYLFGPVLKDKQGALISVGTYRTLHDAVMGDFSDVFFVDNDAYTTKFNQKIIESLISSKTRSEFRESLMSPEAASFFRAVDEKTEFEKRLKRLHVFTSDVAYKKAKAYAKRGKLNALRGNLAGTETMADLASALKNKKTKVSVLDLSNALDYIMAAEKPEVRKAFANNLKALPFTEDAMVLITVHSRVLGIITPAEFSAPLHLARSQDNWGYIAVSAKELIKAANDGQFDSQKNYLAFIKEIVKAQLRLDKNSITKLISPEHCLKQTLNRGLIRKR